MHRVEVLERGRQLAQHRGWVAQIHPAWPGRIQQLGRIDILVNKARVSIRKSSQALSLADWNQLTVNMIGCSRCARAAAAAMPAQGGAFLNTASIMGLSGPGRTRTRPTTPARALW